MPLLTSASRAPCASCRSFALKTICMGEPLLLLDANARQGLAAALAAVSLRARLDFVGGGGAGASEVTTRWRMTKSTLKVRFPEANRIETVPSCADKTSPLPSSGILACVTYDPGIRFTQTPHVRELTNLEVNNRPRDARVASDITLRRQRLPT